MTQHARRAARPWGPALASAAVVATLAAGGGAWALTRDAGGSTARSQTRADTGTALEDPAPSPPADTRAAVTPGWTTLRAVALDRLAAADQLLAATAGQVDDESVRTAVEQAATALRAALDAVPPTGPAGPARSPAPAGRSTAAGSSPPPTATLVAVASATASLAAATDRLTQGHDAWTAARAAEAQAQAQAQEAAAAAARWVGTPDCGVPGPEGIPARDASTTLYTSVPDRTGDGSNGRLPRSSMAPLAWCVDSQGHQQWLRADAAAALAALNDEFRAAFGENIAVDLSYRSYDDQVRAEQIFGDLAATPGTSNHGLGTAIDTWESDYYAFGSERFRWLVEHGPGHGWVCPAATERGNPEYWHFEYRR